MDAHLLMAAQEKFSVPGTDAFFFKPIFSIGGFGFTKPILLLVIAVVVMSGLFLVAFNKPKLVPGGLQTTMELAYDFVKDQIVLEVIGPEGRRFTSYLVALFFFVFSLNLFEIIPVAQFPVTSKFAYPVVLAAISWLVFVYLGFKRAGFGYLKEVCFPPNVPKLLYLILTPIEFFSTFVVRPFTLAVRLFANMFAGHLLLITFGVATTFLLQLNLNLLFAGISFALEIVLIGFELLVGILQAYIFTILTAVYIQGALEPEH